MTIFGMVGGTGYHGLLIVSTTTLGYVYDLSFHDPLRHDAFSLAAHHPSESLTPAVSLFNHEYPVLPVDTPPDYIL